MRVDRRKRPISTLSPQERKFMLETLLGVWNDHPRWGLGQLVTKAASIVPGERVSIEKATDQSIMAGLEALIPAGWEVEHEGAADVVPVPLAEPVESAGV